MGCDHDRARIISDRLFKHCDKAQREVIRWFIKQQHVWRVSQEYRKRKPTLLSDTQLRDGPTMITAMENSKLIQRHPLREVCTNQNNIRVLNRHPLGDSSC